MIPVPGVGNKRRRYQVTFPSSLSSISPANGEVYYYGAFAATTGATWNAIYANVPSRIVAVRILVIPTVAGSTETATAAILVNNTTATTISSALDYNSTQRFDNTAMNVFLAAGDFWEVRVTFPTFVTNPTGVFHIIVVDIEA